MLLKMPLCLTAGNMYASLIMCQAEHLDMASLV